jgi:membrane protease YdiL (CAAX protease family)
LNEAPTEPKAHHFEAIDVLAVFCLAVLPDLANSFLVPTSPGAGSAALIDLLLLLIVRSFQVSVPILLILKLRNANWADYGVVKFRPLRDPLEAVGITVLGYVALTVLVNGLLMLRFDFATEHGVLPGTTVDTEFGLGVLALVVVASCANGFAEELAMRSYLLVRICELSGSKWGAAILITALFAAYHSYQGRYGIVSAVALGGVFAAYFIKTKRLWPIAIAHALVDVMGLLQFLTQSEEYTY